MNQAHCGIGKTTSMKSNRIRKLTGKEQLPDLSAAERVAVLAFASKHGRLWKARLSELWVTAAAEPTLHRLRNTHGPDWLRTVTADNLQAQSHEAHHG